MIKILIDNEEVVSNNNLQIKEEMLSTSSTILKNCYPKSWENDKDYVSRYYFPKDYSKCKITDDVYHPEVIGTRVSGTNFTINYNNTLDWKLEEFKGNTKQNGTPTPSSPVPIQSVTGLQNVNVCGKNLCFNVTKPSNANLKFFINKSISKTFTISFTTNEALNGNSLYLEVDGTGYGNLGGITANANTKVEKTYTLSDANYQAIQNGTNIDLLLYKNRANFNIPDDGMVENNSTATEYEPYKGNTYEVNLGKNLFNANNNTYNDTNVTHIIDNTNKITVTNSYSWARLETTIKNLTPNTNYTISTDITNESGLKCGLWGASGLSNISTDTNFKAILTKQSDSSGNLEFYFYVNYSGTTSSIGTVIFDNIQLEKGTQSTSFSPYFTPIELNKIDTYQDRIYKDNGKWYVEKQIGKATFTGATSEGWDIQNGVFRTTSIADVKRSDKYQREIYVLSNYFKGETVRNRSEITDLCCAKIKGANSQIAFNYSSLDGDVNAWNTWLNTHNTEIKYVLATPTYTEITNEELINQLESIKLLKGINNISITSENLSIPIEIHYNFKEAWTEEELIFCGCVKNTGKISLNPRQPHYVDLQILDFKTLLSEGETLNYVITNKTIVEAINQVVNSISDYGFVVGNINILNPNDIINAYSTLNKTAYDVFQYIADITQSKWTTRMIDENTIAIDFYDPTLMPQADPIQSTEEYYEENKIVDISFNYNTNDYRNKQIMTSDEVYANITQTETLVADGYNKTFMCENKIGQITSITTNGTPSSYATKSEEEQGVSADYVYQPGEMTFASKNTVSTSSIIIITYYPIVKGREIVLNAGESSRISTQIGRKGTISRYENRNDTTSSQELQKIGQSYIKYKGQAEITLKVVSELDLFNVGQIVEYEAPLEELSTEYLVKKKTIDWYISPNKLFYTYELSSNFNSENAINYFDNQRAKNQGNLDVGQTITRNIDLESIATLIFYNTSIQEIQTSNPTSLDFELDGLLI